MTAFFAAKAAAACSRGRSPRTASVVSISRESGDRSGPGKPVDPYQHGSLHIEALDENMSHAIECSSPRRGSHRPAQGRVARRESWHVALGIEARLRPSPGGFQKCDLKKPQRSSGRRSLSIADGVVERPDLEPLWSAQHVQAPEKLGTWGEFHGNSCRRSRGWFERNTCSVGWRLPPLAPTATSCRRSRGEEPVWCDDTCVVSGSGTTGEPTVQESRDKHYSASCPISSVAFAASARLHIR